MSIDRRDFLRLFGATATTAAFVRPGFAAPSLNHVVVIGGGILGATLAYTLAMRGVQVTVLEKSAPASGVTGESFAYLNASTKADDRPYHVLNALGVAGWHRLQIELQGALPVRLNGAIQWRSESGQAEEIFATLRRVQEWGYSGRRIDEVTLRALLPKAVTGPVAGAVLYEQEGALDPVATVEALLDQAKKLGATVRFPVEVTGFDVSGNRVRAVKTTEGEIEADAVVLAAGHGSEALARSIGVKLPLKSSKGILIHTDRQPGLLERVVFGPGITIKQDPDGHFVSSGAYQGSDAGSPLEEQGQRILENAARFFPQLSNARVAKVISGTRVLPADGFPVVGFAGDFRNVYVTVTHSAVTLAPVLARFAAQELLDGVPVDILAPYRPSRFA